MDEQLYFLGSGLSLADKVEKAIANLREYEKEALRRDPVNGYYLCDSYGKDSGVILDLAKRSGVRFVAHHNLTTLDPPELLQHGRKHHPSTVVHRKSIAMLTRFAREKMTPPTRRMRWCCSEYKESTASGLVKVFGVRAAESARRASNWKVWTPHRSDGRDEWILNPILYWTDENVWRYTKDNSIPYCNLYDEGFSRLGCIGCPLSNKRRREFDRWPGYEKAWKRAFERFYNRVKGLPRLDGKDRYWERFNSWQDLWRWWMEELPEPDDDDCQMGLF